MPVPRVPGACAAPDALAAQTVPLDLTATLTVNSAPPVQVNVRLLGTGDVAGIDPHQVVRTDPHSAPPTRAQLSGCDQLDRPTIRGCSRPKLRGDDAASMASPANVAFVPWVRQGAAAALTTPDALAAQTVPLDLTATLTVNSAPPVQANVRLRGPGDVVGIDPHQIVRTDPRPGTADFEPNYLAAIEFDRPD